MTEEQHGLQDERRPSAPRNVSAVEREREWLAEQYSKEREAYWEADTVCLTEPDSFTSVDVVTTIVRTRVAARAGAGGAGGVSAATSTSCEYPSRLVAARTAEMGTVSVSDVSFDESESAVMTPAIKATHAITRASTTLRALARRRGGRRTVSTLMPSRDENRQCLGLRQFFGSGTLVSPDLWCPSILWVSPPQRRSISPRGRSPAPRSQLIAIAERLEREVVRPDDDPTGRWIRQLAGYSGVGGRARGGHLVYDGGDPRSRRGVVVRCIPMNDPSPDKQQGVAGHVVDAVASGMETVGYELLAGATLATAAAVAGMGAGHHVAGSAFDTAGATTVGSGFHQAGNALYAVARKNFALAGEAARSALDSFAGPPRTQIDGVVSHPLNPPGKQPPG